MNAPLLVELLTEELPPKALKSLGDSFASTLHDELAKREFLEVDSKVEMFATPRRLAARISNVREKSPDRQYEERLLPEKVGFDAAGKPTPALLKKLVSLGRDESAVASIRKADDGKLVMLYLPQMASGQSLLVGLMSALEEAIEELPIPKVMTYQLSDGITTVKFVRPAHGLVALHGREVVTVSVLGLEAGRLTHGHRFLGVSDIELKHPDEYEARLKGEGKVIANFETRRAEIDVQLKAKAVESGGSLGDYETLLDEVTALVEWPVVYVASFESEFLVVPQECLILTMRTNQRYFPLFDGTGKLTEKFLVVSNMQVADPSNIIDGNRRVVRPRLADARFFYDQDRKVRLETRVPQLGNVVYHNKLGTQLERVERIQLLAGQVARMIGTDPLLVEHAQRAAWLSKADLLTGMVGEFPELQGIMGRYYALHDDEHETVANAVEAHYRPRFAGDVLPQDAVSSAVALADKLDTMAGLFGIGQQPTGEKDPFGLRRSALGVLRILIEHAYPISLFELINAAFAGFKRRVGDAHTDLETFLRDRLVGLLKDRGYSPQEIDSVLSMNPTRIDLILHQLDAVRAFLALPEAASLAAANKRVANILRQAAAKSESFINADETHLQEPAERSLFNALQSVSEPARKLYDKGDFTGYLTTFAALKLPVDAFFDSVMVMVDDANLRRNRLALLADLREAMNRVADISKLAA